jgi:hypothetical protein
VGNPRGEPCPGEGVPLPEAVPPRRRIRALTLGIVAAVLVIGATVAAVVIVTTRPIPGPRAAASASAPTSAAVRAPSPSPSPPIGLDQLKSWVDAARLSPDVVGASKPVDDQPNTADTDICGKPLDAANHLGYAHYWRWAGDRIRYVEHTVEAYQGISGADVLDQIKDLEHGCTSYEETDTSGSAVLTPTGDYAITPPAGVEAGYGFCVLTTTTAPAKNKGDKDWICTGVLARGNIVVIVRVFAEGRALSLANAQHNLDTAVAAAGPALGHAVPADYH